MNDELRDEFFRGITTDIRRIIMRVHGSVCVACEERTQDNSPRRACVCRATNKGFNEYESSYHRYARGVFSIKERIPRVESNDAGFQ